MAKVMEAILRCCAGLDVHSKSVAVCVRRTDEQGEIRAQVRTFGTMSRDLLGLCDWLTEEGATHVAMESTSSTERRGKCSSHLSGAGRQR